VKIKVKVRGHAVEFYPPDKRLAWEYEAREGEDIFDMLTNSDIKSELVMSVACCGRVVPKTTKLEDGMELLLFTPVSGG
jgi:molybdopterin converting factor small subunit